MRASSQTTVGHPKFTMDLLLTRLRIRGIESHLVGEDVPHPTLRDREGSCLLVINEESDGTCRGHFRVGRMCFTCTFHATKEALVNVLTREAPKVQIIEA